MKLTVTTLFLLLTAHQALGFKWLTGGCDPETKYCYMEGYSKPCESKYYCKAMNNKCFWINGNTYAKCDKVGVLPPP